MTLKMQCKKKNILFEKKKNKVVNDLKRVLDKVIDHISMEEMHLTSIKYSNDYVKSLIEKELEQNSVAYLMPQVEKTIKVLEKYTNYIDKEIYVLLRENIEEALVSHNEWEILSIYTPLTQEQAKKLVEMCKPLQLEENKIRFSILVNATKNQNNHSLLERYNDLADVARAKLLKAFKVRCFNRSITRMENNEEGQLTDFIKSKSIRDFVNSLQDLGIDDKETVITILKENREYIIEQDNLNYGKVAGAIIYGYDRTFVSYISLMELNTSNEIKNIETQRKKFYSSMINNCSKTNNDDFIK